MAAKLLTQKLRNAISMYYIHRMQKNEYKKPWNKEADLDNISDATSPEYRFEAVAGTFFFKRYTKTKIHYYETNESLFPEFKYECTKRVKDV